MGLSNRIKDLKGLFHPKGFYNKLSHITAKRSPALPTTQLAAQIAAKQRAWSSYLRGAQAHLTPGPLDPNGGTSPMVGPHQPWDLTKASTKGIFTTTSLCKGTVPTAAGQQDTIIASSHPELFRIYPHFTLYRSSSGNLPFAFP